MNLAREYNSSTRLQQLKRVEKVCRYLLEMARCKIKNLLQQMAMRLLRAASAPFPYSLVLSPKQVWGPKGLLGLLHDEAVTGSNAKPMSLLGNKGEDAMAGWVGSIAGFNVYWSDQIDEDVGSGGDAAGFAMSKGAIGLGVGAEGLFRIRDERDEMLRATNYVATGFWGEIEVKDTFGVYILTDVS